MARDLVKNCKGLSGLNACKCCFLRTRWQQSDLLIQHGVHRLLVSVRNFWLFLIVFVPISCFKLVFLWKAIMGCKLLNISLKYSQCSICASFCLLFPLYLVALGCMLMKMVLCLYA